MRVTSSGHPAQVQNVRKLSTKFSILNESAFSPLVFHHLQSVILQTFDKIILHRILQNIDTLSFITAVMQ